MAVISVRKCDRCSKVGYATRLSVTHMVPDMEPSGGTEKLDVSSFEDDLTLEPDLCVKCRERIVAAIVKLSQPPVAKPKD